MARSLKVRPADRAPSEITDRQAEVLRALARGLRTREISDELGISERAVTGHITRLMAKYDVPNRSGLIAAAMVAGPLHALRAEDYRGYDDAPFVVAVTRGTEHRFVYVNRMWERIMGHERKAVVGKSVLEVFPDRRPSTYAARQRAYRTGRPSTGDTWHYAWTDTDGTSREADLKYVYQPLRSGAGVTEGLLLIASEVEGSGD